MEVRPRMIREDDESVKEDDDWVYVGEVDERVR